MTKPRPKNFNAVEELKKIEMKESTPRFCHEYSQEKGCLILDFHSYNPKTVVASFLAFAKLPIWEGNKPDMEENARYYASQWHSNKETDRCSFYGKYSLNDKKYPVNPVALTGFVGRGLFRWGPTKAVGAIVWMLEEGGENKKNFVFVGVKSKTTKKVCTPGGFVDPKEEFDYASKREFLEEAMKIKKSKNEEEFKLNMKILGKGEVVKFGYDDSRELNTDWAWVESVVYGFEITSQTREQLAIKAGSDALAAMWVRIESINEKAKERDIKRELSNLFTVEERIEHILQTHQACFVPVPDKNSPNQNDTTQHSSKKEEKEVCFSLNNNLELDLMKDVARLFLVKKYGEHDFLTALKEKSKKLTRELSLPVNLPLHTKPILNAPHMGKSRHRRLQTIIGA